VIYKPSKLYAMWDTWLYYHKGTHYLYYLTMGPTERQGWHGQGVALATSTDGVHWNEGGVVIPKDDGATGLGTGSVWKAADFEKTGRFLSNYSTWFDWAIQSQTIRFAESTDLVHWKKLGADFEFKADPRWYEVWPEYPNARWDCIYTVPRPGGGLYGYWTALPKERVGFGFGETLDGVRWTALEPPVVEGTGQGEVGAIEWIGDRYYMQYHGGNLVLTSDRPQGPWRPVSKNPVLLGGNAYFTRFHPTPDGLLVNHQCTTRSDCVGEGTCCLAPLKRAVVDAEGTLRLGYWEGNDRLKGKPVAVAAGAAAGGIVTLLGNTFDADKGFIVEGTLRPGTVLPHTARPNVGLIPCPGDLDIGGIYVEWEHGKGTALVVDRTGSEETGVTDEGRSFWKRDGSIQRDVALGESARFRLLVKESFVEFYLDDVLILVYSVPGRATGRVGVVGRATAAGLSNWRGWEFSL